MYHGENEDATDKGVNFGRKPSISAPKRAEIINGANAMLVALKGRVIGSQKVWKL